MLRSRLALHTLALVGPLLGSSLACAGAGAPPAPEAGLAIEDFAYVDTSGEPGDQAAAHQQRLQAFMSALRRDFAAGTPYHLVPFPCRSTCTDDRPISADLLHAASQAGAKILIIGGIHKVSTLVQWAKVTAIDVDADRIVFDKLFTFRGDSDEAWERAETFVSREIGTALAPHGPARGETK